MISSRSLRLLTLISTFVLLLPLVPILAAMVTIPPFGNRIQYALPGATVQVYWNKYLNRDSKSWTVPPPPVTDSPSTTSSDYGIDYYDYFPEEASNASKPDPREVEIEINPEQQDKDYQEFSKWYHENGTQ